MKLTHVIPWLKKGGAERVVVLLANEAAAAGHEVTVVAAAPVDPKLNQDALLPQVRVRFVDASIARRYTALAPWTWRNRRWLLDQDVVHCHLTFGSIAGLLLRWLRNASGRRAPKILETYHAVGMPVSARARLLSLVLAKRRDGCVLMAQDEAWAAFGVKHPHVPLTFIPNGVDSQTQGPGENGRRRFRTSLGIPEDAFVVGTVGRLIAERNPLETLRVFAEIARRTGPEVHFLMGGDGPMGETVAAEAERLGLGPRLHLPGLIVDVPLVLSAIDLYVSMNVRAVTGVAGLEAAAAGVPVVALQALENYEGGVGDWIWSSPRPDEVAAEAVRLYADSGARMQLAQAQRTRVEREFSAAAMWQAYEAFYRTVGAVTA